MDGVVQLGWPTAEEATRPARRVAVPDAFGGGGLARPAAAAGPAGGGGRCSWNSLVDGVVQLGWPTAEEATRPARRVAVPDAFGGGGQQYVQTWCNALLEELNLRWVGAALSTSKVTSWCTGWSRSGTLYLQQRLLEHEVAWLGVALKARLLAFLPDFCRIAETAQAFHSAMAQAGPPQQQRPPARGRNQGGGGAGERGSADWPALACVASCRCTYPTQEAKWVLTNCVRLDSSAGNLEARLRQARVVYHSNCELFIWKNLPGKVGAGQPSAGQQQRSQRGCWLPEARGTCNNRSLKHKAPSASLHQTPTFMHPPSSRALGAASVAASAGGRMAAAARRRRMGASRRTCTSS